jgi:hypothetical protein
VGQTNEKPAQKAVSGSQSSLAEVGDPKEEWAARCSAESSGASFCDSVGLGGNLLRLESLYNMVLVPLCLSLQVLVLFFPWSFTPLDLITYGIVGLEPT